MHMNVSRYPWLDQEGKGSTPHPLRIPVPVSAQGETSCAKHTCSTGVAQNTKEEGKDMAETGTNKKPTSRIVLDALNGMWLSYAVQAAARYDLATLIGEGAKTTAQLAKETSTHEFWTYRVLRFLAANGIFEEVAPRTFANTDLSTYLRNDVPTSMYAMARMMGSDRYRRTWGLLEESMRTGTSAVELLYGMDLYAYFDAHPEEGRIFDAAMTSFSGVVNQAIATAYDFSHVKKLVDVGGGHGSLLQTILAHYPTVQSVLFDRPSVIEQVRASGSAHYELVAGDFFEGVPQGADVYLLKKVLHNWKDQQCVQILTNCRRAMHSSAVVLVCEQVVPDDPNQGAFAKGLDLLMGLEQQGEERTREEFRALYEASGFRLERVIPTASPHSILEGVAV
jgi:O-methyltransferase domain